MWDEPLLIATRSFRSRLVGGSERYPSAEIMQRSHDVSGAELVAVAVRGLDLASSGSALLTSIEQGRFTAIATTSGCRTADEAVRTAYLAREAGLGDFVGGDVMGDEGTERPHLAARADAVAVPVIVAGGVGTASDAALAMELGCHAVMVGTAVAEARDPEVMAEAMRHAVEAGRGAYKAGRIARRLHRNAFGPPECA